MKQVVQNYKSGELALLDVPVPGCKPDGVLVRSAFSLISTGTELMKVSEAGMSMLGKARSRPDQVAKVVQSVATNGVPATYRKVMGKLDSYTPLGYSLCGVVEQVGAGIDDVKVGDLVACAGNEHALHAELNWVPKNLYTPVPDGLAPRHAAFGTVGSIAMQGVRQGEPHLGEVALVIGLGLIGQLVVQLLAAAGVRVVGADPDPARCELAERLGAAAAGDPASAAVEGAVAELTGGHGVDQVYLAAGGGSNQPVELAARLSRDRGRVVDIGKCRLDLPWNAYYEKELDVRFSRSYGPGRYDPSYELEGRDYPIGYVRWTERRNLACFLDLVARGSVDVEPLISHIADFEDAVETYGSLKDGELKAVAVLFRYPEHTAGAQAPTVAVPAVRTGGTASAPARAAKSPVRLAFVGAGNYATSMLLPHLAQRDGVELSTVVTTTALSGANAQRKFGFAHASTDLDTVLGDDSVDAVFVVTRHSSHADLTRKALLAGKTVFVEKPLALTEDELAGVLEAVEESGNDRLQVGFNRRFAPLLQDARKRFGARTGPASLRYLVNAGRLDHGSWYLRQGTEGTRFTGEGGHFIDTASWLLGADPVSVYAVATPGNEDLQIVLGYPDGSTAAISYVSTGAPGFPKETLDLVADGKVLRLDDFVRASVYSRKKWVSSRLPKARDKGQSAELAAFIRAVRTGGPMPVPLESLVATTAATLAVQAGLASGVPVTLAGGAMTMTPGWYLRRLSRMGPREVGGRIGDTVRRRRWRAAPPARPRVTGARFTAVLPAGTLDTVAPDAVKRLVAEADRLLAGHAEFFGVARDDMADPDWCRDPKTGRRAPSGYAFDVPYRDEDAVGDIKQIWEPSRHQYLTVLAAAYALTGDERYAERVAAHLRSWWDANPPLRSVHWTSGIELGIRLLSWVWIRRLLDGWQGAADLFEDNPVALDQIWHHQRWLAAFPSRGSSANNHVIAEAAGQLAGACAFGWFPSSARWRADALRSLDRHLRGNTFASGLNRELATEYHGLVLELGLAAVAEADAAGVPVPASIRPTLLRMTDALAAVVDSTLRPPRQGDADDGHGLILDGAGTDRWGSLLATGEAVFGRLSWWPEVTGTDVRTPLLAALLRPYAREKSAPAVSRPASRPGHFADAGLTILRGPQGIWARCDGGPHGFLSIAAHAHADALSVEVRHDGVDVLADPGTFCYHGQPEWRRYFRSTLGHNTLQLDGEDQSVSGGPFLWTRHARSRVLVADPTDVSAGGTARWYAEHHGYRRSVHRRRVELTAASRELRVVDEVRGPRREVRLAFHLGPAVTADLAGGRALLTWTRDGEDRSAVLELPGELDWRAHRGESDPPLGWYSAGFGRKEPATTLVGTGFSGNARGFTTVLRFHGQGVSGT